jgi:chromosome segregation ATPase
VREAAARNTEALKSQTATIEKLRAAVGEAERRAAATETAVNESEQELVASVDAHRKSWLNDAEARAEQARERARKTLDELERAVAELRTEQTTAAWLRPDGGFDRAQQVRAVHVGYALSSKGAGQRTTNHSSPASC